MDSAICALRDVDSVLTFGVEQGKVDLRRFMRHAAVCKRDHTHHKIALMLYDNLRQQTSDITADNYLMCLAPFLAGCVNASLTKEMKEIKLLGQFAWQMALAVEAELRRCGTQGILWGGDGEVMLMKVQMADILALGADYEGLVGRRRRVLHYFTAVPTFFTLEILMNCQFSTDCSRVGGKPIQLTSVSAWTGFMAALCPTVPYLSDRTAFCIIII